MSVSAQEQLFIYLLNRARANPAAYQQETGMPADLSGVAAKGPLAVNNQLIGSSGFHANEMATHNYFGHQSSVTGDWPNEMARDAGFPLPSFYPNNNNYIESIAAGYPTPASALYNLILDANVPGVGHRVQLLGMDSFFGGHREIGVGYAYNSSAYYGHYWAIHTAVAGSGGTFLTGVAYDDLNGNGRYDLNEGLAGVTISAGGLTTTTNAAGGWSLAASAGQTYQVSASGGGFRGTALVTAQVGSQNTAVDFLSGYAGGQVNFATVAPPNSAPVVHPLADQTLRGPATFTLSASDAEGNAITYSARVLGPAYQLKQQLGLAFDGSYYQNAHGQNEKWLYSPATGNWYALFPNGDLRNWRGNMTDTLKPAALVATLDTALYADPGPLWAVNLHVSGNQLTITPATGFTGQFIVEVSASDGMAAGTTTFNVTVQANQAPTLGALNNQTFPAATDKIVVTLSGSDPDGDVLTYSAQFGLAADRARQLRHQLGLAFDGDYYQNAHGLNEKWLYSPATGIWYALLPSGELRHWKGNVADTLRADALVANLESYYHLDPSLLWDAHRDPMQGAHLRQRLGLAFAGDYYQNAHGLNEKWLYSPATGIWYALLPSGELRRWSGSVDALMRPEALEAALESFVYQDPKWLWDAQAGPIQPPVALTVQNNQLTIDPRAGFTGSFIVAASVSDGAAQATRYFLVTVPRNTAPTLAAIAPKVISGQDHITVDLSASDADGDTLTLAAQIRTGTAYSHQLRQQLGLTFEGDYYQNAHGLNEKWLYSPTTGHWYALLPSGELRHWKGNVADTLRAEALVARLDPYFYIEPRLLWDPQAGPALPPVSLSLQGNRLTIDPAAGYRGTFVVEIVVSDGLDVSRQWFSVVVQ